MTGWGFPVLLKPLLYPVKEVLRDNGRDTAGGDDMTVTVFPDILPVLQHTGNKVQINLPAPYCGKAILRHILHDFFHRGPLVVADITFQHHGGGVRVDLIILVLVDDIAESGGAAVILAFQGVLCVAPYHLFGQFGGVVFRHALQHTFQDDTLRAVGNILRSGQHLDAILAELRFIVGAVVAVAGETVKFPNDDNIKEALGAVPNHALEVWAVVGLGGHGPVNVCPQDGYIVLLAVGRTLPQLALDAFFPLVIAGIPGVNHRFHSSFASSDKIRNSASFNR